MIPRLYVASRPESKSSVPALAYVVLFLAACAQMGLIRHVECENYTVGAGYTDTPTGNGGNYTWTNTVDGLVKPDVLEDLYQQWADSINVTTGDTLLFDFIRGQHTVFLSKTEAAYLNCDFSQGSLETIPDTIPAAYTVKSTDVALYFTCTVPGHCVGGQKVKIIPYGTVAGAPNNSPNSAPQHSKFSAGTVVMLLFVSIFALFVQSHLYL